MRASASVKAADTSASPPVFANGCASGDTIRIESGLSFGSGETLSRVVTGGSVSTVVAGAIASAFAVRGFTARARVVVVGSDLPSVFLRGARRRAGKAAFSWDGVTAGSGSGGAISAGFLLDRFLGVFSGGIPL